MFVRSFVQCVIADGLADDDDDDDVRFLVEHYQFDSSPCFLGQKAVASLPGGLNDPPKASITNRMLFKVLKVQVLNVARIGAASCRR